MGKNQAYKAMQRARLGGASGGPDEIEDGMVCTLPYQPLTSFIFLALLFLMVMDLPHFVFSAMT